MPTLMGFNAIKLNVQELCKFQRLIQGFPDSLLEWYYNEYFNETYRKVPIDTLPVDKMIAARYSIMRHELESRGVIPARIDLFQCPKYKAEKKRQTDLWKQWALANKVEFD